MHQEYTSMEITKKTAEFLLKNMLTNCSIELLKREFSTSEFFIDEIRLGYLKLSYDSHLVAHFQIINKIKGIGLEIIADPDEKLVEEIKLAVYELILEMNNADSIARKSDYLVEKLNLSYQKMSKLFSKHENITLERYIILVKMEKIKDLIDSNDYTLSEIAYLMDYSSVQYLSNQFKKETGYSVSDYKNLTVKPRIAIENIGKTHY